MFQKLFHGALDVARGITALQVFRRLRLPKWTDRTNTWFLDDEEIAILRHGSEANGQSFQVDIWTPMEEEGANDLRSVGNEEDFVQRTQSPIFPNGDPSFIVTKNTHGEACYAAIVTDNFLEALNTIALKVAKFEIREAILPKLEKKEEHLLGLIENLRASADANGEVSDDKKAEIEKLNGELNIIQERKYTCEGTKEALENAMIASRERFADLLEDAAKKVSLLRQPELGEDDDFDDLDLDTASHNKSGEGKQEPDRPLTEAEEAKRIKEEAVREAEETRQRALRPFRKALDEAQLVYDCAQYQFDCKEAWQNAEIEDYERRCADGREQETKTDCDLRVLQYGMAMTADLIDAGIALDRAKAEADEAGVFDEERQWLRTSPYADHPSEMPNVIIPSILDSEQVDYWEFEEPLTEYQTSIVERWLSGTDEAVNADYMPTAEEAGVEEWEWREPEIHETFSMVDFTPQGRDIWQWQMMCEETRHRCREDFPAGSPREIFDRPLKRRMSC